MTLQIYKIASTTVGSAGASTITFSSIPQGYRDLKFVASTRLSSAGTDNVIGINVNGSGVGTSFTAKLLQGSGSSVVSSSSASWMIGGANADGSTANSFTSWELYVPNYAGSTNKSMSVESAMEQNATLSYTEIRAMLYSSTTAISSIEFSSSSANFKQYSIFTLYGIL